MIQALPRAALAYLAFCLRHIDKETQVPHLPDMFQQSETTIIPTRPRPICLKDMRPIAGVPAIKHHDGLQMVQRGKERPMPIFQAGLTLGRHGAESLWVNTNIHG